MPLQLEPVKDEGDFAEIARVLYTSFGEPYNSLRQWFIPIHTTVEAAMDEFSYRLVQSWKKNQSHVHWIKAVDTDDNNKIIGVAEWEVRTETHNPDEPQEPIVAYWHLEGPRREFAGKLLTSLKGFMKARMTRPHIELEQLVVLPTHRGRGAGKMLTEWGVQMADELGIETCVESVPFAVPFYEKMGYGNVAGLDPEVKVDDAGEEWKEWAAEDLRVFLMWRPAGRDFRGGEDSLRGVSSSATVSA
ncbi:acyl-CoA N-acyltransferase [Rhypophila decipiens]|uniref:Acyl-CoA N-acyltransferase n=1 Tax=Rhypophila decipiens TaxID=261697 RepID=A0AAN6Y0H3_9PEZI|nr:acyl-CoA N-acyltransferase [Rhypophila decipiens]